MKSSAEMLRLLRSNGWSVAIHNDYRQDGERRTFWLFTHGGDRGLYVKGEASTDEAALRQCLWLSTFFKPLSTVMWAGS